MVAPVNLSVFAPLPVHRIRDPRPVQAAEPPAAAEPAPGGHAPANPAAARPLVTGATAGQLLGIHPQWAGGASAFAQARAAGAYGLASMAEVGVLTPVAPRYAYEEVSGLGYFPGDLSSNPASQRAYLREQISAARDAARRERDMSKAAGVEVRLAYDPNSKGAVSLHPGDEGYDDVRGAQAAFARMRWDLGRMGQRPADYADLLAL